MTNIGESAREKDGTGRKKTELGSNDSKYKPGVDYLLRGNIEQDYSTCHVARPATAGYSGILSI